MADKKMKFKDMRLVPNTLSNLLWENGIDSYRIPVNGFHLDGYDYYITTEDSERSFSFIREPWPSEELLEQVMNWPRR